MPRFPFDVAQLMAKQGLMGITLPESDGGQGGSADGRRDRHLSRSRPCARAAPMWCSSAISVRSVPSPNTARRMQKERWLGELLAGRMVMSLGMTEPDAGSALTDLKTSARADGAHYIINGSKVFSTFSPEAQIFLDLCALRPRLSAASARC